MPDLPLQVIVTTRGKDPSQWIQEVKGKIFFELQERLVELGNETAERMKDIIASSRKRADKGTHLLENSITSELLSSTAGVHIGIGNIAKMVAEAPYWQLINDGGTYVTKRTFTPPPFEDGEFRTFVEGSSHTIEPLRYVDIASEELTKHIHNEINRLMGEI